MEPTVSLVPSGSLELFAVDLSEVPSLVPRLHIHTSPFHVIWKTFVHSHRTPAGKWERGECHVIWLLGRFSEVADEHGEQGPASGDVLTVGISCLGCQTQSEVNSTVNHFSSPFAVINHPTNQSANQSRVFLLVIITVLVTSPIYHPCSEVQTHPTITSATSAPFVIPWHLNARPNAHICPWNQQHVSSAGC